MRILIAEDDPAIAAAIQAALKLGGHAVDHGQHDAACALAAKPIKQKDAAVAASFNTVRRFENR